MFKLDPEIQILIKMRYLLRQGGITDVGDLETKVKLLEMDSNTLQDIADDMSDDPRLNIQISRASLGRWFGKYTVKSNISKSSLNAIAKYLLCIDWNDFTNYNIEDIEEKMFKEHNLTIAEQLVSMDSKAESNSFGLQRIISHNIDKGKIIEIRYGKHNKLLKLKKLSDADRYLIMQCDSNVLSKGWSINIPAILLGVNIIGLDIKDKDIVIKSIYKSSGTVTNITKRDSTVWD